MFKRKEAEEDSPLYRLIRDKKTLRDLTPEGLIELHQTQEVTSLIFSVVQDELIRRIKGEK